MARVLHCKDLGACLRSLAMFVGEVDKDISVKFKFKKIETFSHNFTLSKKRNATEFIVVIVSVLLS